MVIDGRQRSWGAHCQKVQRQWLIEWGFTPQSNHPFSKWMVGSTVHNNGECYLFGTISYIQRQIIIIITSNYPSQNSPLTKDQDKSYKSNRQRISRWDSQPSSWVYTILCSCICSGLPKWPFLSLQQQEKEELYLDPKQSSKERKTLQVYWGEYSLSAVMWGMLW